MVIKYTERGGILSSINAELFGNTISLIESSQQNLQIEEEDKQDDSSSIEDQN